MQWGLAGEDDPPWVVSDNLGSKSIASRSIRRSRARHSQSYLDQRPCDLVVFATHGRDGIERWLRGSSCTEAVLRRLAIQALFMTQGARGLVRQVNGDIQLRRILIPIKLFTAAREAVEVVLYFISLIGGENAAVHFLHIGDSDLRRHSRPNRLMARRCRRLFCGRATSWTRSSMRPSNSTSISSACPPPGIMVCSTLCAAAPPSG